MFNYTWYWHRKRHRFLPNDVMSWYTDQLFCNAFFLLFGVFQQWLIENVTHLVARHSSGSEGEQLNSWEATILLGPNTKYSPMQTSVSLWHCSWHHSSPLVHFLVQQVRQVDKVNSTKRKLFIYRQIQTLSQVYNMTIR